MRVNASAPGKMVLVGEYAVLFGHPAVVASVNRRAEVGIDEAEDEVWSVVAPGIADAPVRFTIRADDGFRWREAQAETTSRLVLVKDVLQSLVRSGELAPAGLRPARLTLDTTAFFNPAPGGRAKLGLGSSAALTVALTEALRTWAATGSTRAPLGLDRLLAHHRSFQAGRGSGIDLAASALGGVVEYRLAGDGDTPTAVPTALPECLHMVVVWTGQTASTSSFLAQLDESMAGDDGTVSGALVELGRRSSLAVERLRTGDAKGFSTAVEGFCDALEALGDAAGILILSPEHRRLRELARRAGVAYKPSGAGGGDVGVGFTVDAGAAAAFRSSAAGAGFLPLDLEIDSSGVEARTSDDQPSLHDTE